MRQALALAFLVLGAGHAGPVGQYLGLRLGQQATKSGWGRDSLHLILPTPSDTVINTVSEDTVTVASEIVYHGQPGYELITRNWVNGSLSLVYDTVFETSGVYLRQKLGVGDTAIYVNRYRIPFAVGASWHTGATGIYLVHLTDTTQYDTIRVWGDSSWVVAQETVTTPWGTFPDCYKICPQSRWRIAATIESIPTRDSVTITSYQWYAESLWAIKDSTYTQGRAYILVLIFWLRAAEFTSQILTELTSLGTAGQCDQARHRGAPDARLKAEPNPFHDEVRFSLPEPGARVRLTVYDATGQLVRSAWLSTALVWQPEGLAPGVYLAKLVGRSGRRWSCRLVLLR